jgi:hypothetical protein
MALWGNKDTAYSTGTVNVDLTADRIHGTVGVVTFTDNVEVGNVITVGTGATYGYAVITGVSSARLSIASTAGFVAGLSTVTAATYNVSEEPIYAATGVFGAPEVKTTGYSANPLFGGIVGVSTLEQEVARDAGSKFRPAHAGWVGIVTTLMLTVTSELSLRLLLLEAASLETPQTTHSIQKADNT